MREAEIHGFIATDYVRVVRAVAAICGDREHAEDAVQDAIVDVWTKRREVDDLAGWVTTAAINRVRSRWRSAAAERRAFGRLARRPERDAALTLVPEIDDRIARALGSLPRNQRAAVALHYLLDMSVLEVARRLNIAEGTAKVHLHRGRNKLRQALDDSALDSSEIDDSALDSSAMGDTDIDDSAVDVAAVGNTTDGNADRDSARLMNQRKGGSRP